LVVADESKLSVYLDQIGDNVQVKVSLEGLGTYEIDMNDDLGFSSMDDLRPDSGCSSPGQYIVLYFFYIQHGF
jgi:hypothetical protein